MKLKATGTRTLPQELFDAFDSPDTDEAFCQRIAIKHLHVRPEEIGPATHYVQESDRIVPRKDGTLAVEVTLSKVSVNWHRSVSNFHNALQEIKEIYSELIRRHVPRGTVVQLFCTLQLDEKIPGLDGKLTNLLEIGPFWIEGEAA